MGQTDNDGLYFDGVDDNVTVPNTTYINSTITSNRTYETSFKVAINAPTTKQIIMKEGGGTRAVIIYVENGYLYLGAFNRGNNDYGSSGPRWEGTFYREPIVSDTWYHVALVFDNALAGNTTDNIIAATTNNALKWYLDGALMGQISGYQLHGHNSIRLGYKNETLRFPSCGSWTTTGASEYCFGTTTGDSGGDEYYFKGYLWGFRVWNDVRTITEIQDNATNIITTVGTDGLVAALDGDSFTYLNSSNTPTEASVTSAKTIIWSSTAGSSDWGTGSNWVGGVIPNSAIKQGAEIQVSTNYPEIRGRIVTGDLTINEFANVTVISGGTLEVTYDMTNNGTVSVEDSGSLILREKIASISDGTFNISRMTPTYPRSEFYSYWSSPVISTDSNIATVFPDAELIYKFDASVDNSDWAFTGTSDFETGIGYAVQNEGTGGQLRTFSGNINKGDIVVDIYNTSNLAGEGSDEVVWSTSGDNLVGNPYSSAINWDLVITDPDNTEINGEIYLWKQNTAEIGENNVSDYLVYNLTGTNEATSITNSYIGSAQGFFIKTESSTSDLKIIFKTTHQVANENTQFYRSSNTNSNTEKTAGRSWFSFNHNDKTNTLLVGFLEGATNDYDRLYDAPFDTSKKSMGFYTLVNGASKAAIQGLPELKEDEVIVEMGYVVDEAGTYSIDMQKEYIDESYFIYLLDTEKDIFVNLRQNSYDFTIETIGENTTRFKIIYTKEERNTSGKSLGADSYSVNDSKNLTVFINEGKELIIAYDLETVKKVTLFTIQGREVAVFLEEQTKDVSNLSTGVYIVAATLEDNSVLNKKIMIAN